MNGLHLVFRHLTQPDDQQMLIKMKVWSESGEIADRGTSSSHSDRKIATSRAKWSQIFG